MLSMFLTCSRAHAPHSHRGSEPGLSRTQASASSAVASDFARPQCQQRGPEACSAMFGHQHGEGFGLERLKDVRQVARIGDVITRAHLDGILS